MRGLVRLRRIRYMGRTSSPWLSGDGFASLCDISIDRPIARMSAWQLRKMRDATTVFCRSEHLEELLAEGSRLSVRALLVGNSDLDFHAEPDFLPPHLRILLLQNSFVSDNRHIYTLPIGIENLALGQNGRTKLFVDEDGIKRNKKVLVGPFSPTHPMRSGLCAAYRSVEGPWFVVESRLPADELRRLMMEYGWVLCPRGNGVDTHRVWEALYRGATPIVSDSTWSRSLRNYGLPLVIESSIIPTALGQTYIAIAKTPPPVRSRHLPWLWLPTWANWIIRGGEGP